MKNVFSVILIAFLGAILLSSCGKDTLDISENISQRNIENGAQVADSRNSARENEIDWPIVIRDRYKFRDFEHLTVYYKTLDAIYARDDQEFNGLIARNERFTSVHTKLINDEFVNPKDRYQPFLTDPIFNGLIARNERFTSVHTKLINDEFVNPKDRYQPFLTDPIMMGIVNEYFEFQVGEVLVTYMNNEEILICDPDDKITQSQIRTMPKGDKLNLKTIPDRAWWGTDTNTRSFKSWCGCDIEIEQISCNEVRVFGACKNFAFGSGDGTIRIELNSIGFPPQTHRVDGNFEFIIPINSQSVISINASADPDCLFGNLVTASLEFDPNKNTCDPHDRTTGYLWAQDSAVQGYSHRTSCYKNWLFSYEEAKIWSKWWDGTRWKPNKAGLNVTIDAIRRNFICKSFQKESETKTCYCEDKRARVNAGINTGNKREDLINHCDGDVKGTYKKSLSWQGLNWSIDAIGEVDFECCE